MKQELNDHELQKTAGGAGGTSVHPSLEFLKAIVYKYCPQCGEVMVRKDQETCPKCGRSLTDEPE